MSLARKILENTFVQILGRVITAGFSVIILKVISSYLGAAGYGDYTTIYQFLALFGIIADFGIYTITVKEMSRDLSKIPQILGNIMSFRTVMAVGSMILAVVAAYLIPKYQHTVIPLGVVIATLVTFFTILNGTVSSVLQVHLKMQYATIALVIGKIASVAYMLWVVYAVYPTNPAEGFYQLIWSGVVGNAVMFFVTTYFVRRYTKISFGFDFAFWKRLFWESLPYGVALMLNTIYFRLDVILMTLMLPHTQAAADGAVVCPGALCSDTEIGLYGVAQRMLEMLVVMPIYFMNAVLPVMTRYIEEKNQRIKELMQYSFDFLTGTSLPILAGGFILAAPLILLISDREYLSGQVYVHGSDYAVKLLMFAMVFSFVNTLFGFTLVVLNKQKKLMWINAAGLLFNFLGNLLVIPSHGFRGAAFVTLLSEAFILIFMYRTAQRQLGFHLQFGTFFKTLLSALLMGAVVALGFDALAARSHFIQLGVLVPLGALVYAASMWLTGALSPETFRLLKKSPDA